MRSGTEIGAVDGREDFAFDMRDEVAGGAAGDDRDLVAGAADGRQRLDELQLAPFIGAIENLDRGRRGRVFAGPPGWRIWIVAGPGP